MHLEVWFYVNTKFYVEMSYIILFWIVEAGWIQNIRGFILNIFWILKTFLWLWVFSLRVYIYVYALGTCLVSKEAREDIRFPKNWNLRWFSAHYHMDGENQT